MNKTQEQIEKLKTLQESYDAVATTIETQLPAIAATSAQEATLLAESAAIKDKIDTSDIAKESTLQYIKNVIIENEEDITFIAASNEEINNELDIIWNELWNQ